MCNFINKETPAQIFSPWVLINIWGGSRTIVPRKISPWIIVPWAIAPRTITPQDNCSPDNYPPGQLPPGYLPHKQWPPEKLPPENYPRVVNLQVIAPQTISPSWLPKIILSSKIFCKFFTNNVFSFWVRIFLSCINNLIWPSTSSPLIFQQNSYIWTERQKNIFAYLQLNNFVV